MLTIRILTALGVLLFSTGLSAQYFGQNKPRYHKLDFEVLETPHFEIYHYLKNKEILDRFADDAEKWYTLHKAILRDSFVSRNPILLYNDHADFQMTNAIHSHVGIGTGGVTESLKNRVVMPLAFTHQQTHHVLGHELVHAFQYGLVSSDPELSMRNLSNIPLWMVEGLAEYLSIGNIDPHTAMWMRSAVMSDDIPSIEALNTNQYFPYRYGHAFWTFVTGTFGDAVVRPLFIETAKHGLEKSIELTLGITQEELSKRFIAAVKDQYGPYLEGFETHAVIGRSIISEKNSGSMNISPSMSPNGRYIVFASEVNLFTIDLYLATASGKVLKKLTTLTRDGHLDDLAFIESAGTWSRNSKEFAFVAFKNGRNVIVIKEVETGKTRDIIEIEHIPAISNPAWSPDGKQIIFTGMIDGQTDLFSYHLRSGRVKQLTNDIYSEIHVNFNKEGTHIVFATDQQSLEQGRTNGKLKMGLAVMNLDTGIKAHIRIFNGADNVDPHFDEEDNIVFLSDRDGYRNLYKFNRESGNIVQMTKLATGISGISPYSPAISVSQRVDRIVYTHYNAGKYEIVQTKAENLLTEEVSADDVDLSAARLPGGSMASDQFVQSNLEKIDDLSGADTTREKPYRPRFELDHIGGGAGIGVGNGTVGSQAGLAGGVDLFFSDITGNHQLFTTVALNGSFQDIGGQITYLNRKNRVAFGGRIAHMPQRYFVGSSYGFDTVSVGGFPTPAVRVDNYVLTIFEEHAAAIAELPFSKNLRLEGSLGATYRSYRMDKMPSYYYENGGFIGDGDRERQPLDGDEYDLGYYTVRKGLFYNASVALVGDNSQFGMTAPMNGYRYRVEATKYAGTYDFWSTNVDVRGYQWLGPVALAVRMQHGARHGRDANNFNPIFMGWQGFVRGYTYNHLEKLVANTAPVDEISYRSDVTVDYRRLSGSKYFLTGFEVRLPFTGPEKLAQIKSRLILTDLNFFFDAGAAFDEWSHFRNGEEIIVNRPGQGIQREYHKPKIAMSTGMSLRVNVFNAMIVEPYVAYPLQKYSQFVFGLNFVPGW